MSCCTASKKELARLILCEIMPAGATFRGSTYREYLQAIACIESGGTPPPYASSGCCQKTSRELVADWYCGVSAEPQFPLADPALVAWYDASQLAAQTDDTDLASWPDLSGNGNNLTSPGPHPHYRTSGINGLPAVEWTSSDFGYGRASFAGGAISQPWSYAIALYENSVGFASTIRYLDGGETTDRATVFNAGGGSTKYQYYAGTTRDCPAPNPVQGVANWISGTINGASSTYRYQDGSELSVTGDIGSADMNGLTIGCKWDLLANAFQGLVGEVMIFSDAHDAARLASLDAHFEPKWMT